MKNFGDLYFPGPPLSESKSVLLMPRASRPDIRPRVVVMLFCIGLTCLMLYALVAPYLLPSLLKIGIFTGIFMLIQLFWDYRLWNDEYAIATTFPFGFSSMSQLLKHKWPTIFWLFMIPTMGICRSATCFLLFQILWWHLQARVCTRSENEFGNLVSRVNLLKAYFPKGFASSSYILPVVFLYVILDASFRRALKQFGVDSMAAQYSFTAPLLILIGLFLQCDIRQRLIRRYYETQLCDNTLKPPATY